MPDNIVIEPVTQPTDEVRVLVGELEGLLSQSYTAEQRHGLPVEQIFKPHIRFFITRLDNETVGCGGVAFFDGFAELKRMYVRKAWRGRGVAQALLAHLENETRAAGHTVLRLETGDKLVEAMRLYRAAGFDVCPIFGDYRHLPRVSTEMSVFMEKRLQVLAA